MSLTSTLNTSAAGLKTTQAGLDIVSTNVANAKTDGYVRKTLVTSETTFGGQSNGVKVDDIRREIDTYLQKQLRTENSGANYASTKADYLDRLQTTFGTAGGDLSLDTVANGFKSALDALATSPDDQSAQAAVVSSAQTFAQTLNAASKDVQSLRSTADQKISDDVDTVNDALTSIAKISKQIMAAKAAGSSAAGLEDQRDQAIDTLSSMMDVSVADKGNGDITVTTQSGVTLYDQSASKLSFTKTSTMDAGATYPTGLSGITVTRPSGYSVDLLASGNLRSGELKALTEIRDVTAPQAQNQLDELAANLTQALGTKTTAGAAVTDGVDLTTSGAQSGDKLTVSYTSGGTKRSVTLVNVKDASQLPLKNTLTADPNDTVIGVDFSSATAATDINAALTAAGIGITAASSASGFSFVSNTLPLTVTGGASAITTTAMSGSGVALPVFTDGGAGTVYSGSLDGGSQLTGYAGRITVNASLVADPSQLTTYANGQTAGDGARATFLRDALTADRTFSASTGIGSATTPYTGSVLNFASATINAQASASARATQVSDGQSLVVSSLSDRLSKASGVDVDAQMTDLITLQTAYSANARVMTAVRDMLDELLKI